LGDLAVRWQMPGHRLPDSKGKMCHDIVYPEVS